MLKIGIVLHGQDSGYSPATYCRVSLLQSHRKSAEGAVHEKDQLSIQLDTILTARSKHVVHKKPRDFFFLPKSLPADS